MLGIARASLFHLQTSPWSQLWQFDMATSSKTQSALLKEIDTKIGEVRTEAIDLSYGEIISLKSSGEIIIDPEY